MLKFNMLREDCKSLFSKMDHPDLIDEKRQNTELVLSKNDAVCRNVGDNADWPIQSHVPTLPKLEQPRMSQPAPKHSHHQPCATIAYSRSRIPNSERHLSQNS
jgi:hypothetical protein